MNLRCACIHDLAGLGHCSLTAALPILAAMGVHACPVPTAILSSQTDGYSGYSFLDMTGELPQYLAHWIGDGVRFHGVYTGFLGSERQIALVEDFIRALRASAPDTLVVVDPVMGDDGVAYDTYSKAMCDGMCTLAGTADVITPNLTEAALLLGEMYENAPRDARGLEAWAARLARDIAPRAVITGVPAGEELIMALSERGETLSFARPRVGMDTPSGGSYPGSGDIFASVLAGALLKGETLAAACARAAYFIGACVARTAAMDTPRREGLYFEGLLAELIR